MAEVRDGGDTERALGALDEEALVAQLDEDGAKMTKMIRLGLAVYQDVVKENEHKAMKEWAEYVIHESLERCRGVA